MNTTREIKFRAWENNRMYNDLAYVSMSGKAMSKVPDTPLIKPILMQFTGMRDRNGKEIYEGDALKSYEIALAHPDKVMLVKAAGCTFVVYNPMCCDVCKFGPGCIGPLDEWPDNTFEIIGNIYENPELLQP